MRKIYIALAIGAAVTLSSCGDFLDPDNRSNVPTEDFYNTKTGYESLTNSMYSTLRQVFNRQPHVFVGGTDLYGDGKSQGMAMTYYTYTVADQSITNFYSDCYKGIQAANEVIAYGETTEQSASREQYIDEARFIRAWYYFQLVQQFGGVPLANEMYESAVMEFPRNTLAECYKFIIDELSYCASASSKLVETSNVGRANKRAAKFFLAKAYLTRAWLNGQDEEAQEENIAESSDFANAQKYILEAIGSDNPSESIERAFDISNEQSGEFFWTVQYSGSTVDDPKNDGSYQMAQFGAYLGGAEFPRTKAIDGTYSPTYYMHQLFSRGDGRYEQTFMLELYGTKSGDMPTYKYFDYYYPANGSQVLYYYAPWWATEADIEAWRADDPAGVKRNAIIGQVALDADKGYDPNAQKPADWATRRHSDCGVPCIKKFDDYTEESISNRNSTCSMHDVSCARLGEAYLIAAEAYLMQGDKAKAAEMINILRQRPGTVKKGYEQQMTVTAADMSIGFILDERARELAGEYVRWTDLKRTHKLVEYVLAHQEDPVLPSNLQGPDGKYKILRPIPQEVIDRNKADIQQNPGY
ncbi:MAG: RagB/SusD family nutrient uptake outer membrane protein [Bacteroidales bacterium]|nr:RagB/SusD family nutrient uptake outer membrane protein [Bacteroidales bacterium]